MTTFDKPLLGVYKYSVKNFRHNSFTSYRARCEILGESDRSYYIRLLEPIATRVPGDPFWVRKKNIILSPPEA